LILATIGARLWTTGFFSHIQKGQPGNSQALNVSEKGPQIQPRGINDEARRAESQSAPEPPKEQAKNPPELPKEAPKQAEKQSEQKMPEQPYDLKGDRLGMSLQDFKTKYRHRFQTDPREAPFCSDQRDVAARESDPFSTLGEESWHPKANIVNARITFPFEDYQGGTYTPTIAGIKTDTHLYSFIDGRLYLITYSFAQSGFSRVKEAMEGVYGEAKSATTKEYQNLFGAKFDGVICMWDNGVSGILLAERHTDLKTSQLILLHHELGKVAEARRSQFGKPRL